MFRGYRQEGLVTRVNQQLALSIWHLARATGQANC